MEKRPGHSAMEQQAMGERIVNSNAASGMP